MAGKRSVRDKVTGEMKLVPLKGKPYTDKVFRRLEASVPREELERAMDAAPDERAQQLLMRLMDPAFRKHSLPKLAKDVGLTYPQVLHYIQRYRLDEGLLKMSAHVPQVLEDVAIDSKSKEVTCPNCEGSKVVAVTEIVEDPDTKKKVVLQKLDDEGRGVWKKCLVCDGAGTIRQVGDTDSRKLLFETMKLTGNRGPLVAIQQNMGGAPTMEDSMASVRDVLDVKAEPAK
jgi:hypothetical protein